MPTATATKTIDRKDGGWDVLDATAQINDGIIDITVLRTSYGPLGEVLSDPVIVDQQVCDADPDDEFRLRDLASSMFEED